MSNIAGTLKRVVLMPALHACAGFCGATLTVALVAAPVFALTVLREAVPFGYGFYFLGALAIAVVLPPLAERLHLRRRVSEPRVDRSESPPDTTGQRTEQVALTAAWDGAWRARRARVPTSDIPAEHQRAFAFGPPVRAPALDCAVTIARSASRGRDDLRQAQFIADFIVFPDGEPWPPDRWRDAAHTLVTGAILHVLHGCAHKSLAAVLALLTDDELTALEIVELIKCGPQFVDLPSMITSFNELARMAHEVSCVERMLLGQELGGDLARVFREAIERVRACVAPSDNAGSGVSVDALQHAVNGQWLRTTRRDPSGRPL